MKKAVFFIAIISLLMANTGGVLASEQVTISTLDYEDNELVVVDGNVTLQFNWSENNNNDLIVVRLLYDPSYNFSIYKIESKNITIDYSFINNTKEYHFNESINVNDTRDFVIKIDYSTLIVPVSPIGHLRELAESLNMTIATLTGQVINMTNNWTNSNQIAINLQNQASNTENQISQLIAYQQDAEIIIADYYVLQNTSANKTIENINLANEVRGLEGNLNDREKTISDLENPFVIFYTKGEINLFHINVAWLVIGGIIFLVGYILISGKFSGSPKTFIEKTTKGNNNPLGKIFGKGEKKKTEPIIWEDKPDIEKNILKDIPKPDKTTNVENEVDKALNSSIQQDIDSLIGYR